SHLDDALDDIDATDEQRVRIQAIGSKVVDEALVLYSDHDRVKTELKAEWDSKNPDSAKVHTIIDERLAAFGRVVHRVADAAIEIHGILTPEQRAEVSGRVAAE